MECHETGSHEAIHIPKEVIELAQEIHSVMEAVRGQGHGDGEIKLPIRNGRIPFIDWTFRKFRKK